MNFKYLIIFTIFFLSSCLPEQQVRQSLDDENNSTSTTTDGENSVISDDNTEELVWFNSGTSSDTLTIDVDNKKSVFLMGSSVHNYLTSSTNFTNTYCIEIRFTQSASARPNRIRVKATPAFSNNFNSSTITRFFSVNLGTSLGNAFCQKNSIETVNGQKVTIASGDSDYDGDVDSNDTTLVDVTTNICPSCQNFVSSTSIILYKNNNNGTTTNSADDFLERVETELINYPAVNLRIDMNSNSDSGQSSCSNNDCIANGFDCCLDGQCVNEKGLKEAGIIADPSGFSLAESLKSSNPNWYKNYPQFYYACLESPPVDEIPTPNPEPEDPEGEADDRLAALTLDYACVEELKTNSLSDPFHRNPINSSATYSACNITDSSNDLYYQEVMKRLYTNCGCVEKTNLTTMVQNCPAYTYEPLYANDNLGNVTDTITAFSCVVPPVEQTPLPFQDLEVLVNSRSAPHRFFDTTNTEIDPTVSLPGGASGVQEGTEFLYLDTAYIFPQNSSFNMNSILGQMTVALDQARPAHKVSVDFDKQYIISTRSGFFQPCPTCAKDSWFNNFSAFAYASMGVGTQPVGFTTRRDTFGTNSTLGNYEDTHFSRACYLPPTMLPFSHNEDADTQDQRQLRLKTQAAMYINGYQKDWYGFNKGALIGSFDGVTWFAIGKGRIVRSTSDSLYLAINAPFADLTSPTNHIVAVQEYDFSSTAPIYDYEPSLEINDTAQNEAGTCQEWHECDTDSHCISKLGWEYTCADVTQYKTTWPVFDPIGAVEASNDSRSGTIIDFLQQGELPPNSGSKRCVYRGAGSPCRVDYENISDEGLRKALTCAPNFYCARLSSLNTFNSEVSRFARPLDELITSKNHYFGMDANILGRPLHYINEGNLSTLPSDVQATIETNLLITDTAGTGNFGLCRPGKLLPEYDSATTTENWRPSEQHSAPDPDQRTDYISQIGSCNSVLYTDLRYASCPILDESGNYIHTQDEFINDNFSIPGITLPQGQQFVVERYSFAQNSCGLESLNSSAFPSISSTGEDLKNFSSFRTVEGSPLSTSNVIVEQSYARDACLRKAGSVCHTDLDCSPNRLMASVVDLVSVDSFGNAAEKTYYEEYLVCGQARTEPTVPGSDDYNSYNIHNNRCCREVGNSVTMFTEDSPNATESQGINSSRYGALNPTATDRYSRYSVVDSPISSVTLTSSIFRPTANTEDSDNNKILDSSVNITNQNQWKTIHNAASKICCGGNWVREFDDGTNDWSQNRLNLNPTNFQCLNYRSALQLTEDATAYGLTQAQLDRDRVDFCPDGGQTVGGCSQRDIDTIDSISNIERPSLNTSTGSDAENFLSSGMETMDGIWDDNVFSFSYFVPYDGNVIDLSRGYVLPWTDFAPADLAERDLQVTRLNLITKVPVFIPVLGVDPATTLGTMLRMTDPQTGAELTCTNVQTNAAPIVVNPLCDAADADSGGGLCGETDDWSNAAFCPDITAGNDCCYLYDPISRILRVSFSSGDRDNLANYDSNEDPELRIRYTPVGTLQYEMNQVGAGQVNDPSFLAYRRNSNPGNALYYLKRLSQLEYLGIPQMVYEPTYCNDNYQKLVPGVFKEEAFGEALETVIDFINHSRTFRDNGVSSPWQTDSAAAPYNATSLNQNLVGTQELIDHSPIFSDNQFKCCLELGTQIDVTESNSLCCSGYAVENEDDDSLKTCLLPVGTNLNVYFNKFVSGEGLSTSYDFLPLTEDDFDPKTGEPLTSSSSVYNKLRELGEEFCEPGFENGNVRRGSAFGDYTAQPIATQGSQAVSLFSIVDSVFDAETDTSGGTNGTRSYDDYQNGFRWNHHVYCDDGDN